MILNAQTEACNYCMNFKLLHGLIYILQPIYTTNDRPARLPAIYHTDSVTVCHMEKSCLLNIHNARFADTTTCALVSSYTEHMLPDLENHARFCLDFAEYDEVWTKVDVI